MSNSWMITTLNDIAHVNPRESLSKGSQAKKIAMEFLQPFAKKISGFSMDQYKGGSKFRNGDTLVARITPCLENGKTAYVDLLDDEEVGFGSTEFIVLREKKGRSDRQFLYYLSISPEFRDIAMKSMTGSSGRQRVQTDVIKTYPFNLPPLHEQKAIAEVLSSLDDKIDLLHRQNKTLEAMAETLFRQWFVEEAEDDWEEGCLGDIAKNKTQTVKVQDMHSGDTYVAMEHIDRKCIILHRYGSTNEIASNKYSFEKGDILFGKLRPYFHKVCTAPFKGVCSTDILVIESKKPHWNHFCLFAFFQDDVIRYANIGSSGTRMPRTSWKVLSQYSLVLPSEEKLQKFNNVVNPILEKMESNRSGIITLEKMRDTLLPKLMSGEVRVKH